MFKVGDKVQRKEKYKSQWWEDIISGQGLSPDSVFAVSKIEEGNDIILFRETGTLFSFQPHKFELVHVNQIEVGGVFKTREGRNVRIICTDCKRESQSIVGLMDFVDTEIVITYNENGVDQWNSVDCLVLPWLEPETDWTKVAVDTLIEVEVGSSKVLRYFSHAVLDRVYFFKDGTTSKTYTEVASVTKQCCKIHKEEK